MLKPGDTFDRYVVEALLGEGGMGQVHRAWDAKLQRRVALKVVRTAGEGADAPTSDARTLREARAAAAFDHPHAVSIFDVGTFEGTTFIAMELVEGKTLRAFVGDRSVSLAKKIAWLLDVARALEAAHRRGLVHRDVKPENVMLRDDGVIKVLDFGIARRVELHVDPIGATATPGETPPGTITGNGTIVGTPFYMPPEQMRGEAIDGRADQFAWGVLAYELIVGHLPWGSSRDALMSIAAMFTTEPRPIREAVPEAPASFDRAVLRALARDREARFPSMGELVAAIESAPSLPPPSLVKPPRSRAPMYAIAALLVVGGGALFASRALRSRGTSEAPSTSIAASSSAVAITDLAAPTSSHPDAIAAYVAGVRASRDGNYAEAQRAFATAVAIDPDLAAAQLRLALSTVTAPVATTSRNALTAAARRRDMLTPRDADLLDALSPLVLEEDVDETAKRIAALAAARPSDAELAQLHAWLLQLQYRFEDAIAESERALALDPLYVGAMGNEEITYIALGKADEALAVAKRCTARAGLGADCMRLETLVRNATGDCAGAQRVAERLRVVDASSEIGDDYFAYALASTGASREAIEEVLGAKWKKLSPAARAILEPTDRAHVAVHFGDFAEALAILEKAAPAIDADGDRTVHVAYAVDVARAAIESGNPEAARSAVDRYLRLAPTWSRVNLFPQLDPTVELLADAKRIGVISGETLEEKRTEWMATWPKRPRPYDAEAWVMGWAIGVVTPDDAKDAVAALGSSAEIPPLLRWPTTIGAVGRTFFLADDLARAEPFLSTAAHVCYGLRTVQEVHARLAFGELLERKGDRAGACVEYGAILARWGNAKPKSTSADAAKAKFGAIGCR